MARSQWTVVTWLESGLIMVIFGDWVSPNVNSEWLTEHTFSPFLSLLRSLVLSSYYALGATEWPTLE